MSQHWFTNSRNRQVLYGSDKPTGGFFYTEFYLDSEIGDDDNDVVITKSSMTIHEIISELKENQGYILSDEEINSILKNWIDEPTPTPLQHSIGKMFGHNLSEQLERTESSIFRYANQ